MQFSKNTSISSRRTKFNFFIKVALISAVILGAILLIGRIDFPYPNKEIKKIIPNEKLKVVK